MVELILRARVGPKGQAVIPKPIRDILRLRPGDEVGFRVEGGRVLLEAEDPKAIVEAFLSAFPKTPEPKHVDWNKRYYEQIEKRAKRAGL